MKILFVGFIIIIINISVSGFEEESNTIFAVLDRNKQSISQNSWCPDYNFINISLLDVGSGSGVLPQHALVCSYTCEQWKYNNVFYSFDMLNKCVSYNSSCTDDIKRFGNTLLCDASGLPKFSPYGYNNGIKLFRRTSVASDAYNNVGKLVYMRGFTSTSENPDLSFYGDFLHVLTIPPNKNCSAWRASLSSCFQMDEVLFAPGSIWNVDSVDGNVVYMTFVSDKDCISSFDYNQCNYGNNQTFDYRKVNKCPFYSVTRIGGTATESTQPPLR
eukprot:c27588_g1_i1.p1 GENE.c27588_g1_i1~~c27588_g1_i1.p1  ORF type:complete len:280 (+),score=87.44 c27588_g1_i1:24-842(+)